MRCPFKIGEKIVCIETYAGFFATTIGKTYEVKVLETKLYNNIGIVGDHDFGFIPNWEYFITVKESRKRKLNKINESTL